MRPVPMGANLLNSVWPVVLDPAGVPPEVYAMAYASVVAVARASWNLS